MTISYLGDGIFLVASAWQVYELSNDPTALSLVWLVWAVPMVAFLLVGGVVSDRFDRRAIMIVADLVRGAAMAVMAALALAGSLELWHVFALVAVYGVADALFSPAFGAIVPDVVPHELLTEANSLAQFIRPLAMQLVGPRSAA
jgi:MFS family permease